MISDQKLQPQHLVRKAVVYLRQSSPGQVKHNLESQHLQYALADRARALGFQQTEIIDSDLGSSASAQAQLRADAQAKAELTHLEQTITARGIVAPRRFARLFMPSMEELLRGTRSQ